MQAKCGTYLNKLNSLYKRSGSNDVSDAGSTGNVKAKVDLTELSGSIALIGHNDGARQAAERTHKNAELNNRLIVEQTHTRSADKHNERIEAQRAAQV